jgi:hypothetical protein
MPDIPGEIFFKKSHEKTTPAGYRHRWKICILNRV